MEATGGDVAEVAEERHPAIIPRQLPAGASRRGGRGGSGAASRRTGRPAEEAA